jgi:tellurite resistance protein
MPVSFFAVIMGLSGLTLATRAAEHAVGHGAAVSTGLAWATVGVMALVGAFYLAKLALHPKAVAGEWAHPVRIAFFPAISISMLLLATVLLPMVPAVAGPLWMAGAALQAVLALAVVGSWIGHRPFQHAQLNPAWFIPAVGNIVVPLAGVPLGFVELSWLFFSAGLVFWVILLTLVFNRLVFHDPLPARMVPTLVILIAPPAVGFVAWLRLGGDAAGVDAFGRILLNAGYLFLAVVLTQAGKLIRLPFALSWWALSFPIAALTIATLVFAERTGSSVHGWIGLGLWVVLAVLVGGLVVRTLVAIGRHEICRPE